MAEPKEVNPNPNPNPNPAPAEKGGDDGKVVLSKEEHENLIKARDSEREGRKTAEADLAKFRTDDENKRKKAEQAEAEKKGEYDQVLSKKDEEIATYKASHDRLAKLEEQAAAKNEESLKVFTDEGDLEIVQSAINGKSAMEAKDIISKLKARLIGSKEGSNFGGGNKPNPDDIEIKEGKVTKLKEEFETILKKQKDRAILTAGDRKRLVEIPKEIKALKKEVKPKD